jgi:hypothetical protein
MIDHTTLCFIVMSCHVIRGRQCRGLTVDSGRPQVESFKRVFVSWGRCFANTCIYRLMLCIGGEWWSQSTSHANS